MLITFSIKLAAIIACNLANRQANHVKNSMELTTCFVKMERVLQHKVHQYENSSTTLSFTH